MPCHPADTSAESLRSIYVVRRGWHTGIAVRARDWPEVHAPLLADLPPSEYVEFGWGDASYYPAEEKTLWMLLSAVFGPSPSVMEVTALDSLWLEATAGDDVVEVRLSEDGFRRLTISIARIPSLARDLET